MKAVDLLINSFLPPDLRDPRRVYTKKNLDALLADVALRYPDRYAGIVKQIADVGRHASYHQGETLTLDDFRPVIDRDAILAQMDRETAQAEAASPSPEEAHKRKLGIWGRYATELESATTQAALAQGNNLGNTVVSGARGNPLQLKSMVTTPALYTDYKDRPIPLFVRRSFGEGLRPAEYLASSFGVRKGVVSTKNATADAGDLLKQMNSATADIIVTADDCGATNGLDYDTSDPEIEGRVLAKDCGDLKAGEVLDRRSISRLHRQGAKTVILRSPMTCQAKHGICAHCLGQLPNGHFAPKGYTAGITASAATGEPLCLHEDTLVRMADFSTKKIKDIKLGDMVFGSDMEGRLKPTRVVNVFHNGVRDCYRTQVRKGHGRDSEVIELISTTAHKVLSLKGTSLKKPAEILTIERPKSRHHEHSVFLQKEVVGKIGRHEPMAALLGLLTGDGCYNGAVTSGGISFSCYEKTLEDWTRDYMAKLGLNLVPQNTPGEFRVSMLDQYAHFQRIDGKLVRNTVKAKLIKEKMWGQGSKTKTAPDSIRTWDNASVAAYIGGCLATDGYVAKRLVDFNSNSKALLENIKLLLEIRFGIYSNRIKPHFKNHPKGGFYDPTYRLAVTGIPNLVALHEFIPVPGIKQQRLNKTIEALPKTWLVRGRYSVVSQEYVGQCDTWDIEVNNDTHLFALHNSLIVSNTQGALNTKHSGGGFGGAKKQFAGFDVIRDIMQSPETFPHRAAVAEIPGRVTGIEDAPQGGKFILVGDQKHYALPGYEPTVKPGDQVEAGDQLSEGIADVRDIVRLRGLGEGRRYYVERLRQAMQESGAGTPSRANLEVLARGVLNHVRVQNNQGLGDLLPDDLGSYNTLSADYQPAKDTKLLPVTHAHGHYLQAPVLHFSIGTQLTPKMTAHLQAAGIHQVPVSKTEPDFVPEMVRLRAVTHNNPDWFARLHSSYLTTTLGEAGTRSRDADFESGTHFAGPLARGVDFGKKIKQTGKF